MFFERAGMAARRARGISRHRAAFEGKCEDDRRQPSRCGRVRFGCGRTSGASSASSPHPEGRRSCNARGTLCEVRRRRMFVHEERHRGLPASSNHDALSMYEPRIYRSSAAAAACFSMRSSLQAIVPCVITDRAFRSGAVTDAIDGDRKRWHRWGSGAELSSR